ncbi:MAG: hypothetical protein MUE58_11840 [Chitinophagaceae bacterium]|jgi:hypothetical protein|nr:hypothetical protein [Chitinophagaceae bacterium]
MTNHPYDIGQKELVEVYLPIIRTFGGVYQKIAGVHARIAKGGEKITTITSDGKETSNTASEGDMIVTNQTESREEYVLKPEQFFKRYVHGQDDYYVPGEGARIKALQVTEENIKRYRLKGLKRLASTPQDSLYIEAPWKESERLRLNDYLACNLEETEVYRIARKEFEETYKPV